MDFVVDAEFSRLQEKDCVLVSGKITNDLGRFLGGAKVVVSNGNRTRGMVG